MHSSKLREEEFYHMEVKKKIKSKCKLTVPLATTIQFFSKLHTEKGKQHGSLSGSVCLWGNPDLPPHGWDICSGFYLSILLYF